MSKYSTPIDIQSYYLGLDFSASDYIKTAKVNSWIEEHSIQIDNSLRRRYSMPITNTNDLKMLKLLVEKFVVGRIDLILRNSSFIIKSDEDKEYVRNRNYSKEANDMLTALMNGDIQLESGQKKVTPITYIKGNY